MTDTPADAVHAEPMPPASPLLQGTLGTQVFWLALPVLAEQMLNYFVGLTDAFLSGRISKEATSAVGVGAYVNWLVEIMLAVIGTGASALVARHWGAAQRAEANRVAQAALVLAFLVGGLAAIGMYFAAPVFGGALGLEAEVGAIVTRYLRISCAGYFFSSICLIGGAALRGSGQMRVPMIVLGIVSLLNILFSTSLVYGIGPLPSIGLRGPLISSWGLDGIAAGTVAARMFGGLLMLAVLASGWTHLEVRLSKRAATDFDSMRRILRIGAPAACDGILLWVGHMAFVRIIASLGTPEEANAALAAHMVFIEVEAVTYLPAWAWGTAAATLIGQCLGAGFPDRARRGANIAAFQASLLGTAVAVLFFFGSGLIYALMHTDPAVGAVGAPALSTLALMEIPLAIAIVYTASVRGAGDTLPPLLINSVCVFGVRLTVGYVCAVPLGGGLLGAWFGMAIDVLARAALIAAYFHWGRWAKVRV